MDVLDPRTKEIETLAEAAADQVGGIGVPAEANHRMLCRLHDGGADGGILGGFAVDFQPDFDATTCAIIAQLFEAVGDATDRGGFSDAIGQTVGTDLYAPGAGVMSEFDEGLGVVDILAADAIVGRLEFGCRAEAQQADLGR